MRFYGDIEAANKEAHERAESYRTAAGYILAITKVLKDFDGKVYNCRLDKALQAATDNRVYVDKTQYYFQIYTWNRHNYSHHITLASIKPEDLTEGKRIPADKLIESLKEHRESLLKKAYAIETNIDQMPQIKEYIRQTKEKLESYCRSFPDDLRDIYGLPYCVRID